MPRGQHARGCLDGGRDALGGDGGGRRRRRRGGRRASLSGDALPCGEGCTSRRRRPWGDPLVRWGGGKTWRGRESRAGLRRARVRVARWEPARDWLVAARVWTCPSSPSPSPAPCPPPPATSRPQPRSSSGTSLPRPAAPADPPQGRDPQRKDARPQLKLLCPLLLRARHRSVRTP